MTHWVPELLSPAGNLEKLKVAVLYGAGAVYLGGQKFGLRSAADNFTLDELAEGIEFAHSHNSKVYVVLNSFLHDKDIEELPEFIKYIEEIGVDAVIVSDLGVIQTVLEHTNIEVHLSTQASCLNIESAKLWKKMGVKRIVFGREVSIKDAALIKKATGLEVEVFVHGSMCMAYSGNCVISNYTQGRDSNRGGCAHSCRFEYSLDFSENELLADEEKKKSYFMSSKDLAGINLLTDFIEGEIDSIKVEGRMKSNHYVGTISKVYADALAHYENHGSFLSNQILEWEKELGKVTHRDYTEASLINPADKTSIYDERQHDKNDYVVVGVVMEVVENDFILLEVRSAFSPGEKLELVPFSGAAKIIDCEFVTNMEGVTYEKTRPGILAKIPYCKEAQQWNIVRKRIIQ
jgi:putative protease